MAFSVSMCRKVNTFDYFKATLLLLQLLSFWFCILSGVFDLENEYLKIIISLVHGEGLKAIVKSWIVPFFSCQFKVRGQAFMGLTITPFSRA